MSFSDFIQGFIFLNQEYILINNRLQDFNKGFF